MCRYCKYSTTFSGRKTKVPRLLLLVQLDNCGTEISKVPVISCPAQPQETVFQSKPSSVSDTSYQQRDAASPVSGARSQRAATSPAPLSDARSQRVATSPGSASRRSAASPTFVMDTASQRSATSVNSELDPLAPSPCTRSMVAHWIDNLGIDISAVLRIRDVYPG